MLSRSCFYSSARAPASGFRVFNAFTVLFTAPRVCRPETSYRQFTARCRTQTVGNSGRLSQTF